MTAKPAATTPVLIGVAQITPRQAQGFEPLDLWTASCRAALADAGIVDASAVTELHIASCRSWRYDDQAQRIAERLHVTPERVRVCEPGGTAGQLMLDRVCEAIRAGTIEVGMICGGEALASVRALRAKGDVPNWSYPHPDGQRLPVDLEEQQHPDEVSAGLTEGVGAVYSYAMREIARRAHLGIAPDAYRTRLGETLAGMTRVAARNPRAWFAQARGPEFLVDPRPDNRMIAYPYTKHMVAMMDVDMAAAVVIASEAWADANGIPQTARVYPLASCYVVEPDWTAARDVLWKSPAMEIAAREVLDAAGLTLRDIDFIDLYSCFPAAVTFGSDALGIEPDGERITMTGGLAYGGGPASSYVLTSIVAAAQALRARPGSYALLSGMSMWMAKHSYAIYSSTRPQPHVRPCDSVAAQAKYDALPRRSIVTNHEGPARIATYTIMYARSGAPTCAALICDTASGDRCYAVAENEQLLRRLEHEECVGLAVMLSQGQRISTVARIAAA